MRWLGKRLTSDPGVVFLMLLSPALIYYGMWKKATSYWPSGLAGSLRLVPYNTTEGLPTDVVSKAIAFFPSFPSFRRRPFSILSTGDSLRCFSSPELLLRTPLEGPFRVGI